MERDSIETPVSGHSAEDLPEKTAEEDPVETPLSGEPAEDRIEALDAGIIAGDDTADSQQLTPWATSLQAFESQGGTTITVDKVGRQACMQETVIAAGSDDEFRPPPSTAPAVPQSTRPKRPRGATPEYYTLQNGSMSQAEVEAGCTRRRFG